MEGLRTGFYQPFTPALVKRHALVLVICLVLALPWLVLLPDQGQKGAGFLLAVFLVLLAVLDGYYGFLYDRLLLPLGIAGLFLESARVLPWGVDESVAASMAAGGFFFLLRLLSRGGLGWGDIKFAGVLGLWLGCKGIIVAVSLAVLTGGSLAFFLLLKGWGRGSCLPFGPFLSLGAYAAYLGGDMLWQGYWELLL